jgi:hypothetical protein
MSPFRILGVLIGCYAVCAAYNGEIHAKSGMRRRIILRDESPEYFWMVVIIYLVLGIALLTVF